MFRSSVTQRLMLSILEIESNHEYILTQYKIFKMDIYNLMDQNAWMLISILRFDHEIDPKTTCQKVFLEIYTQKELRLSLPQEKIFQMVYLKFG